MRSIPVTAVLLVAAAQVSAQDARVMIVPEIGYVSYNQVHHQDWDLVHPTAGPVLVAERIRADGSVSIGLTVSYAIARSWRVHTEIARSQPSYRYERTANGLPFVMSSETRSGTAESLEVGISRVFRPTAWSPDMAVGIGAAIHRLRFGGEIMACAGTPILPLPQCGPSREASYSIPALVGRLSVNRHVAGRIGVHATVMYSAGRGNTHDFWLELRQDDLYDGPKATRIEARKASVGVSIGI